MTGTVAMITSEHRAGLGSLHPPGSRDMRRTAHAPSPARGKMALLAGIMAVAAVLLGCGGAADLPAEDSMTVAFFNTAVFSAAAGSDYGDLRNAIDEVIAIARKDPNALYKTEAGPGDSSPAESRTMRQVLSDAAATLQPYQPDLAGKLDRAVATLP